MSFVYVQLKCLQVLLCHTNNSIWYQLFVCTQLNDYMYSKWLDISFWPLDGNQENTTVPGQSGPESNGSEEELHITQSFGTEVSPSDVV